MSQALRVVWYRSRATFSRRWGGYLSMVVLIGLIGGVAMASVAAARRTQSSYPTFLASTNPSDMTFSDYSAGTNAPIIDLTDRIAHLAQVKRVVTTASPLIAPLLPDGAPNFNALGHLAIGGSTDGMFAEQDRVTLVEGRMADPHRSDEIVMTASAAEQLRVRAGQVLPLGFYTNAQEALPGFGTPRVQRHGCALDATVVGIGMLNNEVVEDDIDRSEGFVLLTPALIRQTGNCRRPPTYRCFTVCSSSAAPATCLPLRAR